MLVLRHDPEELDTRADLAIDLPVVVDKELSKKQNAPTEIDPGVAVGHEAEVEHEERCNWQYVPANLLPPVVDVAAVLVGLEVEVVHEMLFTNRILQQKEPEAAAGRGVEVEHEVAVVHEIPDPTSKQWISITERVMVDIPPKFSRQQ